MIVRPRAVGAGIGGNQLCGPDQAVQAAGVLLGHKPVHGIILTLELFRCHSVHLDILPDFPGHSFPKDRYG